MIGNAMHYFGMSYEEATTKRSFKNIVLLNAAIPGIEPVEERNKSNNKEDEKVNRINAIQFNEKWQRRRLPN